MPALTAIGIACGDSLRGRELSSKNFGNHPISTDYFESVLIVRRNII